MLYREVESKIKEHDALLAENKNIIDESGLERVSATSKFITNMLSWIGLVNTKFTDNATRFYLLAKDKVTTGVGGCLKIFADAYHLGQAYRDLGIYFHADQEGDKGYFGNGVFWINGKVLEGSEYDGKNPDIGFSFQDGKTIAGRLCRLGINSPIWVFGKDKPTIHGNGREYIAEFQKNIGFKNGKGVEFLSSDGLKSNVTVCDTDDKLKHSLSIGEKKFIAGVQTQDNTEKNTDIKNALVRSSRLNVVTDTTSINATGYNRIVLNQPGINIITSITGVDGQEIDVLCVVAGKTTLAHGTSIKLKGGVNYVMAFNSVITLMCVGSTWYEKNRSDNN